MNRIKAAIQEQRRSQTWLAEKLGMSRSIISLYCNNLAQPKILTLYHISKILKIDPKDLLASPNEKETNK
jgi:transcriptional regulator with XRE-family HTH domain